MEPTCSFQQRTVMTAWIIADVGGVIVIGEQTMAYYSMMLDTFRYVIPQPTIFECWTAVKSETEEWLLGDTEGRIYSLSIQNEEFVFTRLGEVASSLTAPNNIDFHTVHIGLSRLFDFVRRISFRRYRHCVNHTDSPSKANHHHQSCTNL